jgi:hypothetical protein
MIAPCAAGQGRGRRGFGRVSAQRIRSFPGIDPDRGLGPAPPMGHGLDCIGAEGCTICLDGCTSRSGSAFGHVSAQTLRSFPQLILIGGFAPAPPMVTCQAASAPRDARFAWMGARPVAGGRSDTSALRRCARSPKLIVIGGFAPAPPMVTCRIGSSVTVWGLRGRVVHVPERGRPARHLARTSKGRNILAGYAGDRRGAARYGNICCATWSCCSSSSKARRR